MSFHEKRVSGCDLIPTRSAQLIVVIFVVVVGVRYYNVIAWARRVESRTVRIDRRRRRRDSLGLFTLSVSTGLRKDFGKKRKKKLIESRQRDGRQGTPRRRGRNRVLAERARGGDAYGIAAACEFRDVPRTRERQRRAYVTITLSYDDADVYG